jgi:hypothetical protein
MASLGTIAGGLLGLIAAVGVGCGFIRLLGPIPSRWRLALFLLSGVAIIDLAVMLVLFLGGGVGGVKVVGVGAVVIGCGALLACWQSMSTLYRFKVAIRPERWLVAVIVVACVINLLIAIAPSTKIDELHYHMLIPKRVLQDGGLHLYRQPFEAAIFPQTAFQLGLTIEHAAGFPEAGNVVSWGLGVALILLVAGVTKDLTGSPTAGWMTGAISAVGLYPAVWYVTSGPHALGDLATVTACLLALLPDTPTGELKPKMKLILLCLAAYTAVSTKISNLPVAATITLIGASRAAAHLGWRKSTGIALGVWGAFYGPILLWTTLQCGSPLGLATATLFHSHYFGPETVARMDFARMVGPEGWRTHLSWLVPSVSVGVVAAFGVVAIAALRRGSPYRIVVGLVCGQALLIYWLLPHEFRFLGGLQYVVLILGAWAFWPSRLGARLTRGWWIVLLAMCLPWLALQVYYAVPFVMVDAGIKSRDSFLKEYVAFTEEFRVLNRILPADAVLYVVNSRIPSYYAPRPVVFTLDDLRGRGPLYRFTVGSNPSLPQPTLSCAETVYESSNAVVVAFRTPGRVPENGSLRVERCRVDQTAPPGNRVCLGEPQGRSRAP